MKKLMPLLRLAFFCCAIFAITWGALLVRDGRLLGASKKEGESAKAESNKDEQKAGMPGLPSLGGEREPPDESHAHAADGARNAATDESAVKSGRALFAVPAPYSIAELSELLTDLQNAKAELEKRKSDLDQREKRLAAYEADINARKNDVYELLQKLPAGAANGKQGEPVIDADPTVLKQLAKILATSEAEMAARALKERPADQIAQVLLEMGEQQAVAILKQLDELQVKQVTEAFFRVHKAGAGE